MVWFLGNVHQAAAAEKLTFQIPYKPNLFNYNEEQLELEIHPSSYLDDMAFIQIASAHDIVNKIQAHINILENQHSGLLW